MGDAVFQLRPNIERELRRARKDRDPVAVSALCAALHAVDNATAIAQTEPHQPTFGRANEVPRRRIGRNEIEAILLGEAREREAAAEVYDGIGRPDTASRLRAEAEIIRHCLQL